MSIDPTSTDRTDPQGGPGPGYAPPQPPAPQGAQPAQPFAHQTQPPQPHASQPYAPQSGPQAPAPQGPEPQAPAAYGAQPGPAMEHQYGPEGLVSTPAVVLPPERVGHGALLALLAVPAGVLLAAVIAMLGFVASLSGLVVAAGAAALYVRGSGGRIKKGIPVIAVVVLLGIVASFFAVVAVDLYKVFPLLDPSIAATYPSRGSFVAENVFYPPVLAESARTGVLLALFGVLGAFGTIVRLVRMNASLQQ